MNRIRQHIPGFVEMEPGSAEFEDLPGLLAIDFVWKWAGMPGFVRFSLSENRLLIAEFTKKWWVVGHLDATIAELPVWRAP